VAACKLVAAVAIALIAANCSSQQKVASSGRTLDPKYGVYASPRVIEEGQPVPKGGGREMVGKPYQVAGRTYVPQVNQNYSRVGLASWYGADFHGRLTANGEIFDRESLAAAHPTMPLPSYARVTNLENRRSMIVRVNDRGPYHADRVMDVSENVAEALGFRRAGTARVKVDYVGRASVRGSDDAKLMATLRTDGAPAASPGGGAPIMLASAAPAPPRTQALAFAAPVAPRPEAPAAAPARRAPTVASEEVGEREERIARPVTRASASPPLALTGHQPRLEATPALAVAAKPPLRPIAAGIAAKPGAPAATVKVGQLPPRRPVMARM